MDPIRWEKGVLPTHLPETASGPAYPHHPPPPHCIKQNMIGRPYRSTNQRIAHKIRQVCYLKWPWLKGKKLGLKSSFSFHIFSLLFYQGLIFLASNLTDDTETAGQMEKNLLGAFSSKFRFCAMPGVLPSAQSARLDPISFGHWLSTRESRIGKFGVIL